MLAAAIALLPMAARAAEAPAADTVLAMYGALAEAMYGDALNQARALDSAIAALLASPIQSPHSRRRGTPGKRRACPTCRPRAFASATTIVDDWEGNVNSWPLDEGLIDYVDRVLRRANRREPALRGQRHRQPADPDRRRRSRRHADHQGAAVRKLQEAGGVEANVATGYHAIEFLLWGQDLNGTGPGAGNRPATDYALTACTHGNCDRRARLSEGRDRLLVTISRRWRPTGSRAARRARADAEEADDRPRQILTGSAACPTASWPASA